VRWFWPGNCKLVSITTSMHIRWLKRSVPADTRKMLGNRDADSKIIQVSLGDEMTES